jgi:hypothetical protein
MDNVGITVVLLMISVMAFFTKWVAVKMLPLIIKMKFK